MKKAIIVIVASLTLAGCITASNVTDVIRDVQAYTRTICGYIPYADVIRRVLDKSGALDSSFGIASEICTAVTTLPLAEGPGKRRAVVRGVVIRGRSVR